jgi:hypothetical protein
MDLEFWIKGFWLPALFVLGLAVMGLMFAFVVGCDRV